MKIYALALAVLVVWMPWCRAAPAVPPQMVLQIGHSSNVSAVAFAPDGKILASAAAGTVLLWNVASGQTLARLEGHTGSVNTLAFSPDGKSLASGGVDKTLKVWDVARARLRRSWRAGDEAVKSLAWSPDGKTLASGSLDAKAKLWDAQSATLKATYADPKARATWVSSVAFAPDGKTLAVGSAAYQWGATLVWNIASKQLLHTLSSSISKPTSMEQLETNSVAYAPDGRLLATATRGGAVKVWDAHSGAFITAFLDHNDGPAQGTRLSQIAFAPDGKTLAGTSVERNVKLWDARSGQLARRVEGLQSYDEVAALAFSPDGKTVAAALGNGVGIASAATGKRLQTLAGTQAFAINAVAFSRDGKSLVSGGDGQPILMWNAQTGMKQLTFKEGGSLRSNLDSLALSPDGKWLATNAGSGINLWNVALKKMVRRLSTGNDWVSQVAWSPDGKWLASLQNGARSGNVRLWRASAWGETARILENENLLSSLAFSPDSHTVAAGETGHGDSIRLWNTTTGDLQHTLKAYSSAIRTLTFSPSGQQLLSGFGSESPAAVLWDLKSGEKRRTFAGGPACAWSPDGKIIATTNGATTGAIRLWNAQSGVLLHTLQGHDGWVKTVAFSPDGKRLVSGGADGKIIVWNAKTGQRLATLLALLRIGAKGATLDWVSYTPAGYYIGSPGCQRWIAWRAHNQLWPAARYAAPISPARTGARRPENALKITAAKPPKPNRASPKSPRARRKMRGCARANAPSSPTPVTDKPLGQTPRSRGGNATDDTDPKPQ